jgi:hypothetical protein
MLGELWCGVMDAMRKGEVYTWSLWVAQNRWLFFSLYLLVCLANCKLILYDIPLLSTT